MFSAYAKQAAVRWYSLLDIDVCRLSPVAISSHGIIFVKEHNPVSLLSEYKGELIEKMS